MQKIKLIFYSTLLAAVAAGFLFRGAIYDYIRRFAEDKLQELEKAATDMLIQGIKDQVAALPEVSAPPPLRAPVLEIPRAAAELTFAGVFNWTNAERVKNGLSVLKENTQLNVAAELKVRDMFQKQYFAHISPAGVSIEDIAKGIGYEYITLGENLATGGFKSDQDLVEAWMNSAGHRANILNNRYTEIGIAVERGLFEGRTTWLAVQVFGKPLSLCPPPSAVLKIQIEVLQGELQEMQAELRARKEELDRMNRATPAYRQKVEEYNALVWQYNEKVEQLKALIADYNAKITQFNACAAQ